MAITPLNGIGAGASTGITNAFDAVQAALANIVTNTQPEDNVAAVSIAAQLQAQTSALTTAAENLNQGLSQTQVASDGLEQIQSIIGQLQSLALQAQAPTLNANNRSQLNGQFQQLSDEINEIVGTTSFNGQALLNGGVTAANALSLSSLLGQNPGGSNDTTLSIPDQSTGSLFGGQDLDISTSDGATQAVNALGNALNEVTGTQANIGAFQQTINFASANVDSALINQQAAQSSIGDTDFAGASTQSSTAEMQYNAAIAVAAQANQLNPALLQLIG